MTAINVLALFAAKLALSSFMPKLALMIEGKISSSDKALKAVEAKN